MEAHARLIRTNDNAEAGSSDQLYWGGNLKLSEWSANQAEQLVHGLNAGFESLGTDFYDSVFLIYPFPDHKTHGIYQYFGLEPESIDVVSLQPTLQWESFPRDSDIERAPEEMGRVKNVRYDLAIYQPGRVGARSELVYSRNGLLNNEHTIETPLDPDTAYAWTVRARFELDGRQRVTEWSCWFAYNITLKFFLRTPKQPKETPQQANGFK